ncbi:MAG: phosphatidylserine decarboxylase family protein [Candidatus Marinimicrobia bacterium]|nr:phosphatidylserine decarboxylase family protein [Candidatus Neomarinimicrobiota bacterium]
MVNIKQINMRVAKEGKFLMYLLLIVNFIVLIISWYFKYSFFLSLGIFCIFVFCIIFFRDPIREVPNEKNIIISPADGLITNIVKMNDAEIGDAILISIFLNVYNVHVNRMPIDGKVVKVVKMPGKFLAAFDHKSSDENERTEILFDSEIGKIKVKQIAGLIAKRIICYAKQGEKMKIGDRLGYIRFGSRTDLIIPKDVNLMVKIGEKVKGNKTILVRF